MALPQAVGDHRHRSSFRPQLLAGQNAQAYVCLLTCRQPIPLQPIRAHPAFSTAVRLEAHTCWRADSHSARLSIHPMDLPTPSQTHNPTRPPQARAASFKSLYRTRAGRRVGYSGDWSSRRASDTALRLFRPNPKPWFTDQEFGRARLTDATESG